MFSWWPQRHILTDPAPIFGALEVPFSCVRVQSALAHLQHLSRCLLVSAGPMCGVPASQETWRTIFLQVPLRTLRTRTFHFQDMFYPLVCNVSSPGLASRMQSCSMPMQVFVSDSQYGTNLSTGFSIAICLDCLIPMFTNFHFLFGRYFLRSWLV